MRFFRWLKSLFARPEHSVLGADEQIVREDIFEKHLRLLEERSDMLAKRRRAFREAARQQAFHGEKPYVDGDR